MNLESEAFGQEGLKHPPTLSHCKGALALFGLCVEVVVFAAAPTWRSRNLVVPYAIGCRNQVEQSARGSRYSSAVDSGVHREVDLALMLLDGRHLEGKPVCCVAIRLGHRLPGSRRHNG